MDDKNSLLFQVVGQISRQYHNQRAGNTLTAAGNLASGKTEPRLHGVCTEMESLFINYLIQEMRATIDKSGFISGGRAEEIFTSMLDVELSRKISSSGGIGLSSILEEQLGRLTPGQEKSGLPPDRGASDKNLKMSGSLADNNHGKER
ncbi:MAG: rod-binding protein [Desulfobacterales bacterium]|jgi:flagellar protein FlgJ